MNAVKIKKALSEVAKVRDSFVGDYTSNKLPAVKEHPGTFIANTDPSSHPGQHWVAFGTLEPGKLKAFDSFGRIPSV